MSRRLALGMSLLALSACSFEPAYHRPAPAVPPSLPAVGAEQAPPAALSYRDMFRDAKLATLIDQALAKLEQLARAQDGAIGVATALPISVDRIARWASSLEARGIALVPVSALLSRPPQRSARATP